MNEKLKPATLCVQAGWMPKKGEPRVLPIYQSTTFKYETSDQMARLFDLEESGYFYTRLQNPTNDAVAAKIAALEGGVAAMLTSSGQAANFYAVLNLCSAGDHFVSAATVYGGTFNLFAVTMAKMGIEVTFIDQDASEEEIAAAFRPNTKLLFGETITNPGVEVLDIEKFARIAHNHGVPLIVDNTFATPINCRPFEWGADIVTHSTTKYMDGHATAVGGAIVDSGNFEWEAHADKFPGLTQPDPSYHGLSEMLYEYTSSAANNGSGFEGLGDNTPFWNISCGIVLILGRYFPIVGQVAIAGLLANKKFIPESAGTLKTDTMTFAVMTFAVIVIVAALSFFPALTLGPIADYLGF